MTTTAPSPEDFLAAPPDPDEEETEHEPAPEDDRRLGELLTSIAASLDRLLQVTTSRATDESGQSELQRMVEDLQRENRELEDLHDRKQQLIEDVLKLIKPSTAKLSNQVRALLEPPVAPPVEEPTPSTSSEQPAYDADVEEWRAYARRSQGLPGDAPTVIDGMNRSQIRTMLGIPQPVKGGEQA